MSTALGRDPGRRRVFAVGVGVAALALIGGGYSAFGRSDASGAVVVSLRESGDAPVSAPIRNLTPGDEAVRYVELRNDGTLDATSVSLLEENLGSEITEHLRSTVTTCSEEWDIPVDSCAGETRTVASLDIAEWDAPVTLTGLSVDAGDAAYVRVSTRLDPRAGNEVQTAGDEVTYKFVASELG